MNATLLSFPKPTTKFPLHLLPTFHHPHPHSSILLPIKCTNTDAGDSPAPPVPPPTDTVQIRFKRGSRRRRARKEQEDSEGVGQSKKVAPPKEWEAMTMTEKAIELYVGERGLLYWINKFAYASIYIVIGAWILFRFVGPALNLYQLDTPPLSPTAILK
ncbi:hypothetical protein LguiA_013982 [Lonicera macranthoides]